MISFQNVSFTYAESGNGGVLDLNLVVRSGECVLLCGPSGCGKTTVTRLANGLIPHFFHGNLSGQVNVNGMDTRETEIAALSDAVGTVFQNPRTQFFNTDTDSEIVFGLENRGIPREALRSRLDELTEELHLSELRGRNIFELSGGEKQKIAFSSVYASAPDVLVFDEPSSNLDMKAIGELADLIQRAKISGKTILIAEHRIWYLMDIVDRVVYIVHEGHEQKAGFIVGHETNRWVADTSDHNLLLIAPPGAGKTTGVFIPTIYYNARVNINTKGRGASMLIVDCKGTLYNECSAFLRKAGYRTPILNIRDVTRSSHFNLMHEVNCAMDEYMAATDKLDRAVKYGRAERYAKAVASQLVDNGTATVKSEASDYFVETSRGLITGIILLVSQYGQSEERHIISVFKVILEMNGQLESLGEDDGPQANKLEHLLTFCGNERIRYYTGAATSADLKTSMNIFSSALGKLTKFIDAELEQLLCSHDAELDADRFIENPTAVFLISPDENTSRHFINSLYIRNLMNDLIYLAESKYGGRCPRDWLLLIDEFGQQPAIEGVDAATAAIRSRGGRAMLSLQNLTQLEKQYNRTLADIIKGTGQTVMFSFVSPTALSSAKVFSEAMGKETVMTGSTTSAKGNTSVTRSMVGRPLMDAADIIALEREVFIVLKGGCRPFRSRAEGYYKYLDLGEHKAEELPALDFQEIITFDPEAFMRRNVKMPSCRLTRGMFD